MKTRTARQIEWERILALPIYPQNPATAVVEEVSRQECTPEAYKAGFRLTECQVATLLAALTFQGAVIGSHVGSGKAMAGLMALDRMHQMGMSRTSIFLVPNSCYDDIHKFHIPHARRHVGIITPFFYLGGLEAKQRRALARSSKSGIYVMTHSQLSTTDASDLLTLIRPDVICVDEVHALKNPKAARTDRLGEYIKRVSNEAPNFRPPHFIGMSGTLLGKSVKDFAHIMAWCLGDKSPLPRSYAQIEDLARAIDPTSQDEWRTVEQFSYNLGALVAWGNTQGSPLPEGLAGLREAMQRRIVSAPGVITAGSGVALPSIVFENHQVAHPEQTAGWPQLTKLYRDLFDLYLDPSGDELSSAMQTFGPAWALDAGGYYKRYWPQASAAHPQTDIDRAIKHHEASQDLAKKTREWIAANKQPGLDTPQLLGSSCARFGAKHVGQDYFDAFAQCASLKWDGMPKQLKDPVRVCGYKINAVVELVKALGSKGILVWAHHRFAAEWVRDALRDAGLDPVYCPSESEQTGANEDVGRATNAGRVVVARLRPHHAGRNLQWGHHAIFLQEPRSASTMGQAIGRQHRLGQKADTCYVHTLRTLDWANEAHWARLVDAVAIHLVMQTPMMELTGTYNPVPKMPTDLQFLRKFRDAAPKPEEIEKLRRRFGDDALRARAGLIF
jgi:hypothetical protein